MKILIIFSALLMLSAAKPGFYGHGRFAPLSTAWVLPSVGYGAPASIDQASFSGPVSTGAILSGPQSTGAILTGPRTTGSIYSSGVKSGAVLATASGVLAGNIAAAPVVSLAGPVAVAAPTLRYAAPVPVAAGVITNGGGTIGISSAGAVVNGPPTAPVLISGPSGKIKAHGLWGPTLEGLHLSKVYY